MSSDGSRPGEGHTTVLLGRCGSLAETEINARAKEEELGLAEGLEPHREGVVVRVGGTKPVCLHAERQRLRSTPWISDGCAVDVNAHAVQERVSLMAVSLLDQGITVRAR